MSTKANWFVDQAVPLDDEPDPFSAPIQEVGERIDLRDGKAALDLRLRELLRREANLFERGTCCAIKDRTDSSCHACPVSKAHDREDALGVLCRIGREQEVVQTELAVIECRDR